MKEKLIRIKNFVFNVFDQWSTDKAPKLGAALSFYTMFSLAPLLLIVISIAGLLFGPDAAKGQIVGQIEGLIGRQGAEVVETALKNSSNTETGIIALIISFITLIIGSTAVFIELQDSLDMIWKVRPKPGRNLIKGILRDRVLSFALVITTGFLLLVSLLVSAALSAFNTYMSNKFVAIAPLLLELINNILSLVIISLMFALIFKILPDVHVKLKDVAVGAVVTGILFVIGKFLIGLYLGSNTLGSTYGAAGSLVVLLLWVYYSAQILFLGAEFTHIYTRDHGSGVIPKSKFEQYRLETGSAKDKKQEVPQSS